MKTKLTKRILALLLTLVMVLSLLPAAFAEGNHHPFQDVPDGKWYSEAVQYVYENGLMNGTSSTTFDPSGKLTRAMLVTVDGSGEIAETNASICQTLERVMALK
jgi:hypothetical protein